MQGTHDHDPNRPRNRLPWGRLPGDPEFDEPEIAEAPDLTASASVRIVELTHEFVREQLSDYLDDALGESTRRRIDGHLAACPACVVYLDTLRVTVRGVQQLPAAKAPRGAAARIVEQARRESGLARDDVSEPPEPALASAPADVPPSSGAEPSPWSLRDLRREILARIRPRITREDRGRAEQQEATARAVATPPTEAETVAIRIRIDADPLSVTDLSTFLSALSDLHARSWLLQAGRFDDLADYAAGRHPRILREANLTIRRMRMNSPLNFDINLNPKTLAESIAVGIDSMSQAGARKRAAELEVEERELERPSIGWGDRGGSSQAGAPATVEVRARYVEETPVLVVPVCLLTVALRGCR